MGIDLFQTLLAEMGNDSGIAELKADDSGFYAIEADDIVCNMQYVFDTNSLYIFAELGEIPTHLLGRLAQKFLSANLFGIETGGGTLALEKESRQLIFGYLTHIPQSQIEGFNLAMQEPKVIAHKTQT
ncbi:MAG: type III secretion system chaperone [Desulfobacterium sp.]|nr:type III secretion system chaperone [Desulfobacterium sp.]